MMPAQTGIMNIGGLMIRDEQQRRPNKLKTNVIFYVKHCDLEQTTLFVYT